MKSDIAPIAQTQRLLSRVNTIEYSKKNTWSFINKTEPITKSLTLLNSSVFNR